MNSCAEGTDSVNPPYTFSLIFESTLVGVTVIVGTASSETFVKVVIISVAVIIPLP